MYSINKFFKTLFLTGNNFVWKFQKNAATLSFTLRVNTEKAFRAEASLYFDCFIGGFHVLETA